MASLALEFTPAAPGPAQEELLEVFLVGGQALSEAVCRLLVTLAGPQPTEAADAGTQRTFTCRETRVTGSSPLTPGLGPKVWENRELAVRGRMLKTEKEGHLESFSFVPKA